MKLKALFLLIITALLLSACSSESELHRLYGTYYKTHEEAANSDKLIDDYYLYFERNNIKNLDIKIGEKKEVIKVMTDGNGTYKIAVLGDNGYLEWFKIGFALEKVSVFITEGVPYIERDKNDVYIPNSYKLDGKDAYLPKVASLKLYINKDNFDADSTKIKKCTGNRGNSNYKCTEEIINNDMIQ